jgi:hypothetical protein
MAAPDLYPETQAFVDRLDSFIPVMNSPEGPRVVGVDVEGLGVVRQILGEHIGKAVKGDRRALTRLKGVLDDELLRVADEGRLVGDPEGIYSLRKGIQKRADYGRLYGPREAGRTKSSRRKSDPAGRIIEDVIEGGELTSDEIMNRVFGASLGGKQTTTGVLKRVEDIAGRNSPEYNQMRLAAMNQLRNEVLTGQNISPAKFATKWNKLKSKNRDLVNQLFEPEHIKEIDTLLKEMNMAMWDPKSGNPSQTGFMLENIMRRTLGPAMGAAMGGAAAGPLGAMAGGAAPFVMKQAGDTMKDALGKLFSKRIYRMPSKFPLAGAAGRSGALIGEQQLSTQ